MGAPRRLHTHYRTGTCPRYRASVPLVLDANNILHVTGVLPPELAGPDERALIALIRGSRWRDERVWMVCDGGRRASSTSHMGAVIHHAGPGSDADTVISELIDLCSHRRTLCVVSSDRTVCARARRRGCRTLSSEAFLEALARDASRTPRAAPPRGRSGAPARSARHPAPAGDAAISRVKADAQGAAQVAAWLAYFNLARDASVRLEQDILHDAERAAAHLAHELGIRARAAARRRAQ